MPQFLRRNRENGAIQLVEKGAKKYCFFVSASVFGTVEPPLHYAERSRQGHKTTKGETGLCAPSVVLFVIFIRRLNLLYVVRSWTPCEERFIWDFFSIFYMGLRSNFIILQLGLGSCGVVVLQDLIFRRFFCRKFLIS